MSQKNETVTLLLALLITLIFFGAGGWWLYNRFQGKNNPTNLSNIEKISPGQKSVSAQARFSQGEKLLIVEGNWLRIGIINCDGEDGIIIFTFHYGDVVDGELRGDTGIVIGNCSRGCVGSTYGITCPRSKG